MEETALVFFFGGATVYDGQHWKIISENQEGHSRSFLLAAEKGEIAGLAGAWVNQLLGRWVGMDSGEIKKQFPFCMAIICHGNKLIIMAGQPSK